MSDFSAQTVLEQLGGRKFIAMTGANNFIKGENNISFKVPKAKDGIRFVKIIYNPNDTYTMEFGKGSIFKKGYNIVSKSDDIYFDQLQEIFTKNTGLDTHL